MFIGDLTFPPSYELTDSIAILHRGALAHTIFHAFG